ncbi:flagellar hook-associated protein FlgK [Nevskia soli]|uniref:flagellar hook-associated protein FlgK n=1 Tax=Nevskia soli TaxID=418856 RepID=UPI0004A708BD|nr:flagellar hook-associated protein FlgK [Nevskia soli]
MSDMLSIGSSALLAYRTALNVVSQNIANANTPGYSRQRVDLQGVPGVTLPNGTVGNGVQVQSVQRLSSGFLQQQLVTDDSGYNRISTYQTFAAQADSLLSDSNAGLAQPLQQFFSALNGLASTPSSTATRQALLSGAQSLSATFNGLQQQLGSLDNQISSGVTTTVSQINGYAAQLAQLNVGISQATAQGNGQPPNELLDQRDQLLRNIGSAVGISTTTAADGSVNVFLANGQALVLGGSANKLSVQSDSFGENQDIVLDSGGSKSVITSQLSGGSLGGLLDARREVVDPAINQLGQLATTLASAVNAQHAKGMDQYGQLGGAFFTPPTVAVSASSANTGGGSVAASVADTSQLTASDYLASYNGSSWTLTDRSTGASVALSGAGTAASPLTGAGLSLVISGTPAAGDQFLVQPTHFAAANLQVAITDPSRIAAASPVQTSAGSANSGSATIGAAQVTDAGNGNLLNTSTILFTSAATYTINGGAPNTYTSGGSIGVNGVQVQISGTPAAGDSFTLSANKAGSGDSSNAQLLAGISSKTLLDGGLNTLSSSNAALVSKVGAQAQQAQAQLGAETSIRNNDQAQRDSASGVNLDEEAANMMQFQQAYQAAAQVIAASNTLFNSLLSALRA